MDVPGLVSSDSGSDADVDSSLEGLKEALERARKELISTKEWVSSAREFQSDPLDSVELRRARDELATLEARVAEIDAAVARPQAPIRQKGAGDRVALGSRVTIAYGDDEESFVMVASADADPLKGRISDQSPLGQALIGRWAGDEIAWAAPSGQQRARIVAVE